MKRIIRLTESDLTRIVKRVIKEGECAAPPQWLLSYKIDNKLGKSDCSNWEWRKDAYTFLWISLKDKLLILSVSPDENLLNTFKPIFGEPKITEKYYTFKYNFSNQEAGGDLNKTLNKLQGKIPWMSDLNETYLKRIVKRVIMEEKKEDPMKYFENIGNQIQRSVLRAVKYDVNPIRIRNHSNYFKQVVDSVWYDIDRDENTPSKRDFVKFMKRDFADQILSHHQGLGR